MASDGRWPFTFPGLYCDRFSTSQQRRALRKDGKLLPYEAAPTAYAGYPRTAGSYSLTLQLAGIIVDVQATPTLRTAEVKATRTMIERVEERFDLKPERLIGDMAHGNAELSRQPSRMQQVPDEVTLLSERPESEDRSERP